MDSSRTAVSTTRTGQAVPSGAVAVANTFVSTPVPPDRSRIFEFPAMWTGSRTEPVHVPLNGSAGAIGWSV